MGNLDDTGDSRAVPRSVARWLLDHSYTYRHQQFVALTRYWQYVCFSDHEGNFERDEMNVPIENCKKIDLLRAFMAGKTLVEAENAWPDIQSLFPGVSIGQLGFLTRCSLEYSRLLLDVSEIRKPEPWVTGGVVDPWDKDEVIESIVYPDRLLENRARLIQCMNILGLDRATCDALKIRRDRHVQLATAHSLGSRKHLRAARSEIASYKTDVEKLLGLSRRETAVLYIDRGCKARYLEELNYRDPDIAKILFGKRDITRLDGTRNSFIGSNLLSPLDAVPISKIEGESSHKRDPLARLDDDALQVRRLVAEPMRHAKLPVLAGVQEVPMNTGTEDGSQTITRDQAAIWEGLRYLDSRFRAKEARLNKTEFKSKRIL